MSDPLEQLPATPARVLGRWLVRIGMGAMLPAVLTGPALPNICLAIAALGCVLARPSLRGLPGLGWGLMFFIAVGLSAIVSAAIGAIPHPMLGLGLLYTWVALYLAQLAFRHEPTLRLALRALAVMVLASCLLAALQFTVGLGTHGPFRLDAHGKRFEHGVGFMNLHLSQGPVMAFATLLLGIATALGYLGRATGWAATAAAALAVFLSTARMAYLGLAAGVAAVGACLGGRHRWRVVIGAALLAGAAIAILYCWQPQRTARALHGDDGRWVIWRTSVHMIAVHPLIGAGGPEGFKAEYAWRFNEVNPGAKEEFVATGGAPHAHNSFLSIAAEHGLPALACYVGMVLSVLAACYHRRRESAPSWQLALGTVTVALVAGIFEDIAGHSVPAYAFFLVLGIATVLPLRASAAMAPATPG